MSRSVIEPIPGVGMSSNDLHFAADMLAKAIGCRAVPKSPADILNHVVEQACAELMAIAERLTATSEAAEGDGIHAIVARLEAAHETSNILFKLLRLPHAGMPYHPVAQGEEGEQVDHG